MTWLIQRRCCATTASFVSWVRASSAAASSLRMTADVDGSVAIKRPFGTPYLRLESRHMVRTQGWRECRFTLGFAGYYRLQVSVSERTKYSRSLVKIKGKLDLVL